MKPFDKYGQHRLVQALATNPKKGRFATFVNLFDLDTKEVVAKTQPGDSDYVIIGFEAYGLAETSELSIYYYYYYYVANRELFFQRLVERYGQEAITEFLLNQEQG